MRVQDVGRAVRKVHRHSKTVDWHWDKECEVEGLSARTKQNFFDAFGRSPNINTPRPEGRILQSNVTPAAANVSDGQHHAQGRVDLVVPMAFDGGVVNGEPEEL